MSAPRPDFSRKATLTGALVRLVPARREHAAVLHPLLADPDVGRLTGAVHSTAPGHDAGPAWTEEQLAGIYGRWSVAEDRLVWVIEEIATGRIVGESVLNELDEDNLSCGFRLWISGARDRGLGTETVELTLRHALEDQGLHRVSLEVYAFNPRARHVYERAGFVHEGTLRDALLIDGTWVDAHVMGILADEWRERHGRS
ncbi:GNAT family protein [Citricoccus sp. I39-566]|uniref:GNAT family N-acetyltransferase n=1 Tax=Citricoccus sp. I39-566 TaxID=3073268 RepID=UPI0017D9EE6A|nr:GNAT family protein [Citricoccus sp. I39-566]NUL49050.1 GNAT family N-acetyltransferase [Cellulosimicrobium funkei]WMY78769.1 GNAT family protein [Citricoccus sp. I39-566]